VDCWTLGGGGSVAAASKAMEKVVGGGGPFCNGLGKGTVKWFSNVVGGVWAALPAQASSLSAVSRKENV
jgi:hypothetical protein